MTTCNNLASAEDMERIYMTELCNIGTYIQTFAWIYCTAVSLGHTAMCLAVREAEVHLCIRVL